MLIAMNRSRVAKGSEAAFELVWMSRDSHLDKVPGFVEFYLLCLACLFRRFTALRIVE
jgi:heme-degrading monooxygenase HmoA